MLCIGCDRWAHPPYAGMSSSLDHDPPGAQSLRRYLHDVYPTGTFLSAPLDSVFKFTRTLEWWYSTHPAFSIPTQALLGDTVFVQPSSFSCTDGFFRTLMQRDPAQGIYASVLPCMPGRECVAKQAQYSAPWASARHIEVMHAAFWGSRSDGPPTSWRHFLDPGGSGWWFTYAPGSGIFYDTGRALVRQGKNAMLLSLLQEWLALPQEQHAERMQETPSGRLLLEQKITSLGGARLLIHRLHVMLNGSTCVDAGMPMCVQKIPFVVSDAYDQILITLGRALHYDSLVFTASLLNDAHRLGAWGSGHRSILPEIVDLRLPAGHNGISIGEAALDKKGINEAEARLWIDEYVRHSRLSLRDPLATEDGEQRSRPCVFALARRLACDSHPSSAAADDGPRRQTNCGIDAKLHNNGTKLHGERPTRGRRPLTAPNNDPTAVRAREPLAEISASRCACFHTCTRSAANAFLNSIPEVVESVRSPWYGYLQAVYGGAVPLPFPLRSLRFFYHNSARWRVLHPDLDWPMPSCVFKPFYSGALNRILSRADDMATSDPSVPLCSKARCASWLRPITAGEQRTIGVALYPDRHVNGTEGSNLFEMVHSPVDEGSWVEVMRMAAPAEMFDGQGSGCWFQYARGSNVWLKVGKSWAAWDKGDALGWCWHPTRGKPGEGRLLKGSGEILSAWLAAQPVSSKTRSLRDCWNQTSRGPTALNVRGFVRAWEAWAARSPPPGDRRLCNVTKLERIGRCLDGTLGLDSFTFAAYQWGLDTLQFASNNQIGPELVSLHSSCMAEYSTYSEGQFEVRHAASGLGLVQARPSTHRCCMLHPQSGPGLADFARAEQPCRVCRTRQSSACTLGLCNGWWNSSQEGWLHRRLCQCDPVLPTLNCNCLPGSSHCRGEPEYWEV